MLVYELVKSDKTPKMNKPYCILLDSRTKTLYSNELFYLDQNFEQIYW